MTATQRLEHYFAYPKGVSTLTDEQIHADVERQRGVYAEDLGSATLVGVERAGSQSNGGHETYRAIFDVPLRASRSEEYERGGDEGRVLIPLVDGERAFEPFVATGPDAPADLPSDFPNTFVPGKDPIMSTRDTVATPDEPTSELGHTPEQVREIRETGKTPEPDGTSDEAPYTHAVEDAGTDAVDPGKDEAEAPAPTPQLDLAVEKPKTRAKRPSSKTKE